MKKPACRFCSGNIHAAHNPWETGKTRARVHPAWGARVDCLVCGTTGTSCGIWARRAPVPILPPSAQRCPATADMARYDWVVDNLHTHWSLDVCHLVASGAIALCGHGAAPREAAAGVPERSHPSACLSFYAKHGSWLNQVELWFSVLAVAFSSEAISVQLMISKPVCLTILKSTIPITPSVSLDVYGATWCERHLVVDAS